MSDIIDIRARRAPQWKELYYAAIQELEPAKVLQRIDLAERLVTPK
jgi:hypothetical protein